MVTMIKKTSIEMTESDWQVAHAIAQTLVKQETDVNELGKAIAYLRNAINQNQPDSGAKFFKYLKTLVNNGKTISHSEKTLDYYRNIEAACSNDLYSYQTKPSMMLHILGWTARLMRYYRDGGVIGETLPKAASISSKPLIQVKLPFKYELNQVVDAIVLDLTTKSIGIKKTKITVRYELDGVKLAKTEEIYNIEKKGISLKVGDIVKLKIVEISNGYIKKFERP